MIEGSTWTKCLLRAGVAILMVSPSLSHAQVVQNRTIEFPGGGTRNNNGPIGPFCCTGETAIVHDVEGEPAGYIYFYDFDGAMNVGSNQSAASTVSILISSGSTQTMFPSAKFVADSWTSGAAVTVELDRVTYEVSIDPQLLSINGRKYFDMGSLKAIVRVKSKSVVSVGTPADPPSSTPLEQALAQYGAFRSGVAAWFQENPNAMGLNMPRTEGIRFNPRMEPFDIDPVQEDAGDSALDKRLLFLARKTGMLRAQLRAAEYPPALYEPQIEQYEKEYIQITLGETADTGGDRLNSLITSIEQARQASRPDLPALDYASYSAIMHPIPTIFRTSRPGGQVWIISQLRFEVCRAQFSDPYNRDKCKRWRQTDPQNPMSLSGTYVYRGDWNGGGNARGMRTVELRANALPPAIYQVP